ncbi:MAG TPA: hypothetical protein QF571_11950 [Desulfobacterales bacterium]|jgi:hypothetical protein|nr:hypothetical protein [Desulfobacterales bacterium]
MLSLFTNEPHLGHFGVNGFGQMTRMLESEFADRDIEWKVNYKLTQVTPENVELAFPPPFETQVPVGVPKWGR